MCRIKLLFLLIFVAHSAVNTTKLNYPRVLLPIFDKISINFTLEVIEKGCFKWTSSRQDLILITPIYEDSEGECTYSATVTVLSRERRRNTAIVLAEETATGESLRCDVILDVIDKLGVHTTTRQLYLEEAPETFELRAEDSQGNAFTTLEGIEFNWVISPLNRGSKNWSPALRFLTFTESAYHEVPPSLEKFEAKGIKGYMVLLEGINTGTAKVTVNLPYAEYSHVPIIEVYINILANIILEPPEVHILAGDTISFRILQLKMGKLQQIALTDQYFLEIQDTNIATIRGTDAKGVKLGRTLVVLRDRNVPQDTSFAGDNAMTESSTPSAILTVSNPAKLALNLLPYNNWITVEGEKHEIALDLYTSDDQKITLGSRYSFSSELDEMLFYVNQRNQNGSRISGQAVREGLTPVYGQFKELTAQEELKIFRELVLHPTKVILPYDPNIIKPLKIQFEAIGGDGSYLWLSQHSRVLQINQSGTATTIIRDTDTRKSTSSDSLEDGTLLTAHTSIKVALAKNVKITRVADIYFLPPVKLQIVKYNFEAALNDYVHLHVAVFAYTNQSYVPYTRCENLIFDLEFSNQIFQVDYSAPSEKEMAEQACQVVSLRSTATGLSNLRLSYKFQDKLLRDEVTLNVFEKLAVFNPLENEVVLPIGASRNVIYANGPQRIFTLEADLVKSLDYDHNTIEIAEIDYDSQNPMHVFRILCLQVGKTVLNLNIYNTLMSENFVAYKSHVATTVRCVKPRFLNLYATENMRSSCPLEMKNSLLHLKERDDKFEIEIEVQDAKNRRLMNISSLEIEWEFIGGDERQHGDSISYRRVTYDDDFEGIPLPGREVLVSKISDLVHNLRIKGVVTGYDNRIMRRHNIYPEKPNFGISNLKTGEVYMPIIENEIRFMAVNSTLFPSDHMSIFMAANTRERIPIAQGSGFYDFQTSDQGVVQVEFDARERELILTPLRIGHTRIQLVDRCLMSDPSHLSVSVVSIGSIRVEAPDRVERTKSIEAIVKLYDSNDNPLAVDSFNLQIYELSEEIFNKDILSVKLGNQFDLDTGEIRYIITGNNLGETKIIFNAGCCESVISSEPITIQVFPPLRLYPRNSTLVVGSSLQIYYLGGPQSDINIAFSVEDRSVISMESAIVTAQKLGETRITGKYFMKNPTTGRDVIISEDTVCVHVVPLLNIQIRSPLTRIRSGAVMPASVWGLPDLSPMVLGTLENMRVTWSTNQPDVVDVYNIFADAGIEYSATDLITIRIKALNPGKARIQASVELPGSQKITTFVEVVVFKILELDSPKQITMDWILVAPRSTIQLKANLDDVHYKPDNGSNNIVKVTPDGVVKTYDLLGRDLIIAKTFEQTLPIGIEVKNVHYILASLSNPSIKLKQTEEKIPRGMNFVLKVSLHDNLGNEFSHSIEDINDLRYALSHKDMVDVQVCNNLTLAINLPRGTSNMIAITLKDTTGVKYAEDYIKLAVAESKHIYPTKTVFSVGDIICFDSPLTLSSIWTSSNEKILSIDRFTGIAKVLSNRFKLGEKIVVTNGDKASGSYVKYDVEVRDADVIQLLKSYDIFSGTTYRGHLVLRNHLQVDKFTNLIAKNISRCSSGLEKINVNLFNCRLKAKQPLGVQLLEHYKVTPVFEADTGRYACQIDLVTNFNKVVSIVKNNDVTLELEAQLSNGLLDSLSLKFVPGVKVIPESLLAADLKSQELTITGLDKVLQKVEVKSSDAKILQVSVSTRAHGSVHYKVKFLHELPLDEQVFIRVNSPTTLQDIEIPVITSNAVGQKCVAPLQSTSAALLMRIVQNIGLIITAIVLLLGTLWLYVTCNPQRRTAINSDAFNNSSANTSRNTSPPCTPSGSPFQRHQSVYPNLSPYYGQPGSPGNDRGGLLSGNDSPIYGDTSFVSPQKRINRRYL